MPYDALTSLLYAFQICTAFDAPAEVTKHDRRKRNNIEFCSINDFLYNINIINLINNIILII